MIMVIIDDNGYLLGISPRGYAVIDSILLFSYIFKIYKSKCELFFFFFSPPKKLLQCNCAGHSQKIKKIKMLLVSKGSG